MHKFYFLIAAVLLTIITGCQPDGFQNTATSDTSAALAEIKPIEEAEFKQRYNQVVQEVKKEGAPLLKEPTRTEENGKNLVRFKIDDRNEVTLLLDPQSKKVIQARLENKMEKDKEQVDRVKLILLGMSDGMVTQDFVPQKRAEAIMKVLKTAEESPNNGVSGDHNQFNYSASISKEGVLYFSITPLTASDNASVAASAPVGSASAPIADDETTASTSKAVGSKKK